jgi:hypothetical protein
MQDPRGGLQCLGHVQPGLKPDPGHGYALAAKKEDDGRRKKLTAEERACGGRGVDCTYILSINLPLCTSDVIWIAPGENFFIFSSLLTV